MSTSESRLFKLYMSPNGTCVPALVSLWVMQMSSVSTGTSIASKSDPSPKAAVYHSGDFWWASAMVKKRSENAPFARWKLFRATQFLYDAFHRLSRGT